MYSPYGSLEEARAAYALTLYDDRMIYEKSKTSTASEQDVANWKKRVSRRLREDMEEDRPHIKSRIAPGPWDEDLDNYHDEKYEFDLGDGYTGSMSRNMNWSWNGYVSVPDGHPWLEFNNDETEKATREAPIYITYDTGRTIGFDHAHSWDIQPKTFRLYGNAHELYPPTAYLNFADVREEVEILAQYLKNIKNSSA